MSQNEIILHHLRETGKIDAITALNNYGCFRLAARIKDLREQGHPIVTEHVMTKGSHKAHAVYRLEQHAG